MPKALDVFCVDTKTENITFSLLQAQVFMQLNGGIYPWYCSCHKFDIKIHCAPNDGMFNHEIWSIMEYVMRSGWPYPIQKSELRKLDF